MEKSNKNLKGGYTPLRKQLVHVKPILRDRGRGKEHVTSFLMDNAQIEIPVPIDSQTRGFKQILTEKEREFFEDNPGVTSFKQGELSERNNPKDNYWTNYKVVLRKPNTGLVKENDVLKTLNLENIRDYFDWKVLQANGTINGEPTHKGLVALTKDLVGGGKQLVYLEEEGAKDIRTSELREKRDSVFEFYIGIKNSSKKLYELLSVFYITNKSYQKPPEDAAKDWYCNEVSKLMESNLNELYSIIKDKEFYETKLFLVRCVNKGLVLLRGGEIRTADGAILGYDLNQSIAYLRNIKNQETLLKLESSLNYKEDN